MIVYHELISSFALCFMPRTAIGSVVKKKKNEKDATSATKKELYFASPIPSESSALSSARQATCYDALQRAHRSFLVAVKVLLLPFGFGATYGKLRYCVV